MTNLRAESYTLQTMDRLTIKIKSGRIIPAMMTTTACISALETIEIVKVILLQDKHAQNPSNSPLFKIIQPKDEGNNDKNAIKDLPYRNTFLNLALSFMIRSDPSQPKSTKFNEETSLTVWDTPTVSHSTFINSLTYLDHAQERHKC